MLRLSGVLVVSGLIIGSSSTQVDAAGSCFCWTNNGPTPQMLMNGGGECADHCAKECAKVKTPAQSCKVSWSGHIYEKCGDYWSRWVAWGDAVGNPCPSDCRKRGNKVSEKSRVVGFLPHPQAAHKFECYKIKRGSTDSASITIEIPMESEPYETDEITDDILGGFFAYTDDQEE